MDAMELAYLMAAAAGTNFSADTRAAVSVRTLHQRGMLDAEYRITSRGIAIANAALASAVAVESIEGT